MSQLQDLQSQELVLRGALSATAESDDPGEVEQCDEAESQEAILESQLEVVVNKQITLHNELLVLRDDLDRGKQSTIALDDFMKDALELGSRFNDFRASVAANEGADSVQRSATSFCNLLLETKWTKSFYLHWMAEHCGSQQAHIHETISRETGLHSFHVQASENLNNSIKLNHQLKLRLGSQLQKPGIYNTYGRILQLHNLSLCGWPETLRSWIVSDKCGSCGAIGHRLTNRLCPNHPSNRTGGFSAANPAEAEDRALLTGT